MCGTPTRVCESDQRKKTRRSFESCRTRAGTENPEERLIAVSHGDPIKSAVTYYAGLHLDMFDRFDVDLAV
ncbi:MAG: hypothetical protein AUH28_15730 [Acidobacteria bacterium 13_1_40CM_56_16]|nr:MAG: hypothetical protein AUH28_15730 [Acidobacteria bacterium 13_1_40CM_56_16]